MDSVDRVDPPTAGRPVDPPAAAPERTYMRVEGVDQNGNRVEELIPLEPGRGPVMGPWEPEAVDRDDWPKGTRGLLLYHDDNRGYLTFYARWSVCGKFWIGDHGRAHQPGEKMLAIAIQRDDGSWVSRPRKKRVKGAPAAGGESGHA